MTVKNPIIYTCYLCSRTLNTGTASDEKAGQTAAKERWVLGLPHGWAWCERCAWIQGPYGRSTV